jgi:hypothetical protein
VIRNRRGVIPLFIACFLLTAIWSPAGAEGKGGSAFLQSLLIPGWGQYSMGQKRAALMFISTEVLFLGGALSMQSYGQSTRDDYEALARAHAGVTGSHDHDFYVDVGNWMTVDDFNNQRMLERNFSSIYSGANDAWSWDSDGNRSNMEKIRIRSDRAFNSIIYFVAGIAANHLASAIHAGRQAVNRKSDASLESKRSGILQVNWTPIVSRDVMGLALNCKF